MICSCGTRTKCTDSRTRDGVYRKRECPTCGNIVRTVERPVSEWENSTPQALDKLAAHLMAISELTRDAAEIINKHLKD